MPLDDLRPALDAAETIRKQLGSNSEATDLIRRFIQRVQLEKGGIRVAVNLRTLLVSHDIEDAELMTTRFLPLQMKRRGVELRLVIEGQTLPASTPDPALLKAVARGHRWFGELAAGTVASIKEIARREKVSASYVKRLLPLAFLAPDIVQKICQGAQPLSLTAEALKPTAQLPLEWGNQRQVLRCG